MKSISFTLIMMILLLIGATGCIHTYPKGEPVNPTLLSVALDISFEIASETLLAWENPEDGKTDGLSLPIGNYRIVAELSNSSSKAIRIDTVVRYNPYTGINPTIPLPRRMPPGEYDMRVWSEICDPSNLTPLHYDASDLSRIRILPFQEELFASSAKLTPPFCFALTTRVKLSETGIEKGGRVILPTTLTSPAAFIRLSPSDGEEFLSRFPEVAANPRAFSLELSFNTPTSSTFNLLTSSPVAYASSCKAAAPLLLSHHPSPTVMFIPLFCNTEGELMTADLILFNSARAIVSRLRNISIPISPAHTTIISGRFLTNWFEGSLSVENQWGGEIIITQ